MKTRAHILVLLIIICSFHSIAGTHYSTKYNNFSSLIVNQDEHKNGHQYILNGNLIDENIGSSPLLVLDSALVSNADYKYYVKFANEHNEEGKSYQYHNENDGNINNISNTEHGIIFNYVDSNNYWLVSLSCRNSNLHEDVIDNRFMDIKIISVSNGIQKIVDEKHINNNVNLNTGFNVLCVQVNEKDITISIGEKKLSNIYNCQMQRQNGVLRCGYFVGPGAKILINRAVLSFKEDERLIINTKWDINSLNAHFSKSINPFEGYWTYLDRDMEDKWLRLGGQYTIALVETDEGYDIIYIDGGRVKKSNWKLGMLKGRLIKTIFTDNFTGMWIDATHIPINEDVYGSFESGVILNMKFPVYKSQVRFSKVLKK
jgi:hypothetical protein